MLISTVLPDYYAVSGVYSWYNVVRKAITKRVCMEQVDPIAGVVKQLYIDFEDENEKPATLNRILDAIVPRCSIIFVKVCLGNQSAQFQ